MLSKCFKMYFVIIKMCNNIKIMIIIVIIKFILVCDCLVIDKEFFIVFILWVCNVIMIVEISIIMMVLIFIVNLIWNFKDL